MPESTRKKLIGWINRALGVVALWFASPYLGDAFGVTEFAANVIKGTVWVPIAMIMFAPDLWRFVRTRKP